MLSAIQSDMTNSLALNKEHRRYERICVYNLFLRIRKAYREIA